MKILITGGNSSTAIKLSKAFKDDQVILADYGEVPSLLSVAYQLISLGIKNEDTLAHTLLNTCLDEGVDGILPLHGFEMIAVAKAKVLFNEFNIDVFLPDAESINKYVYEGNNRTEKWAILRDGEVFFANSNFQFQLMESKLSGAFYLTEENAEFKLSLITI